jgi:phage-related minor tail protein
MANDTTPSLGDALSASFATAAQALGDFANGPVASATKTIDDAVTRSFDSVSSTIARAALSGKTSIDQLVNAVLADFDRIATSQFIVKPIEGVVSSLISSLLPISGARASGGPVGAGGSYLVGEQGPELFTPSADGAITSNANLAQARPSVVLNVQTQDASSFLKSQTQIAAMMSRALARGQRNL